MKSNLSLEIPGRICLMGDKVDLLGKPVIGMAINLMLEINFRKKSDDIVEFYSHNTKEHIKFNINETPPLDIDLAYWSVLYKRLRKYIKQGFYIDVHSEIPIGAGLSSSAAISVGFIKALDYVFKIKLSNSDIAELAYLGENHDLGIQCGRLDQYTISYGGVVFIHTDEKPRVEQLNIKELPVVVGDTLEDRKASIILNRLMKQIQKKDPITLGAFKVIEECVYQAREALLRKDFKKLGELMDKQQEQERIFQADTQKITKLCEAAKNAGALGAKQMGAGGGGCIVAIAPGKEKEVAEAINKAGGKAWVFDIFRY